MRFTTWLVLLGILAATAGEKGATSDSGPSVTTVPASLRRHYDLDKFYTKWIDADGIPILASEVVDDEALGRARELVLRMTSKKHAAFAKALARDRVRVAILGRSQKTTDIPEHADLNRAFPETNWDERARGLGATKARPATSVGEENLLGLPGDRYRGESILIHEFAHTLHMALRSIDKGFDRALQKTYAAALKEGLFENTYAASNAEEYWAEGVQSWFDANLERAEPDGVHNSINTRTELEQYDPRLAKLIAKWLPSDDWRYEYPDAQDLGSEETDR